jgi:hypothetical protein
MPILLSPVLPRYPLLVNKMVLEHLHHPRDEELAAE